MAVVHDLELLLNICDALHSLYFPVGPEPSSYRRARHFNNVVYVWRLDLTVLLTVFFPLTGQGCTNY